MITNFILAGVTAGVTVLLARFARPYIEPALCGVDAKDGGAVSMFNIASAAFQKRFAKYRYAGAVIVSVGAAVFMSPWLLVAGLLAVELAGGAVFAYKWRQGMKEFKNAADKLQKAFSPAAA